MAQTCDPNHDTEYRYMLLVSTIVVGGGIGNKINGLDFGIAFCIPV